MNSCFRSKAFAAIALSEIQSSNEKVMCEPMAFDEQIKSGINLNDLGFADPTRQVANTWLDWVSGAAVRQGLPARIERVKL